MQREREREREIKQYLYIILSTLYIISIIHNTTFSNLIADLMTDKSKHLLLVSMSMKLKYLLLHTVLCVPTKIHKYMYENQ